MAKFKKGDRVKVITSRNEPMVKKGAVGTVNEDDCFPWVIFDVEGEHAVSQNDLELLKEEKKYKFKVGDKVRANSEYYVQTCKSKGWEGVVTHVRAKSFDAETTKGIESTKGERYKELAYDKFDLIDEDTPEVEIEITERETMETKNIEKELKNIVKELKERNSFDDVLKDEMVKKIKDMSTEELIEDIHKDVNKFIKDNYGVLPKKIEVKVGEVKTELTELVHKDFEKILRIVKRNVPLMLTGPAGAGKNHTLEQVARSLKLDFYFSNAITQEFKLTGFIDANGKYQETQFYKAFKDGGLFFLDEIDASCPDSLIILNSAIANGYFDFPNGRVNANENFRVVCAGNTFGTGADMVYVGRNALDGATLDRFATIEFDYDEEIEKQLAHDVELYDFIKNLRKTIKDTGLRHIVSMRATINASKLLEIGMGKEEILKSVIVKNMSVDDLNIILGKMSFKNDWVRSLEKVRNDRN